MEPKKNDPMSIGDILGNLKTKKPPAYEWQDFALRVIKELNVPNTKRSSVFRVCKQYPKQYIEACLNDTKELADKEKWRYFFKLVSGSNKSSKEPSS